MRLSPASDGNNSKYVLEVVGLINNQKVVELLSSTEWQIVQPPRYTLQAGDSSAARLPQCR